MNSNLGEISLAEVLKLIIDFSEAEKDFTSDPLKIPIPRKSIPFFGYDT